MHLLIAASVLAGTLMGRPSVAEKNSGGPNATQANTSGSKPVVPPAPLPLEAPNTTPCTQADPCYTKDASPRDSLPEWRRPEWVIVYVTIVYSVLTGLMWWTIRRQVNDAKDASDAAALTTAATLNAIKRQADLMERQTEVLEGSVAVAERAADAATNAERARLLIEYSSSEPYVLEVQAFNRGRSSARLTYAKVLCQTLPWGESLPEIPPYNISDYTWTDDERWIHPKRSTPLLFDDLMSALNVGLVYGPEVFEGISSDKLVLWVFGFIRYIDAVSNEEKRTHFCHALFWYEDGQIGTVANGPESYSYET